MKYLSLLLVLFFATSYAQDTVNESIELVESSVNWYTDYDTAQRMAKSENKPMLVYFTGSDWCKPCVKLKRDFFNTAEFAEVSKKYVVVMLDIPYRDDIIPVEQKKINKIKQKDLRVKTFPTLLALDSRGRELNRMERYSYPDPQYYWQFMKKNKRLFNL